jgi:3-oxoadipate enol-lactonase
MACARLRPPLPLSSREIIVLDLTGDPDGRAVVLLPAFGLARSMWKQQMESLAALGYRVGTLDLPGLSGANEPDFSMEGAGNAIAESLAEHVRRPAHLVGISIGATLALQVALDHPSKVASVLLSGGQAHPGLAGRIEWSVARILPERLMVGGVPGEIKKAYPTLAAESVALQQQVGKRRLVAALREFSKVDLRPRLPSVSVPAFVVCGSRNRASMKGSRTLAAGIPGARLEFIEGVGHVWSLQEPQTFTRTVDDFVRSVAE